MELRVGVGWGAKLGIEMKWKNKTPTMSWGVWLSLKSACLASMKL